ncbi:multicopper oxidase [Colletotrichum tofieldiae]|nr:multicopper oxidase [Colletotrichum tofieldiae]
MPSSSFTNFPELPAELRLKVWGEATARPSMHIFDVCFPSWRGGDRSKRAFQATDGTMSQSSHARWTKYSECVFLDSLEVGPAELARQTSVARHAFDPSVYRFRRTMRLACPEASAAVWRRMRGKSVNTVYLPGRNERIQYDNDEDVLFLRFRDGGAITDLSHGALFGEFEASGMNGLTDILEGPWSTEMAETLRDAQCIALDVAETWDPSAIGTVLFEEVAYLACCLHQGLRVLYLVDHCHGRCTRCKRHDTKSSQLQARGGLYRELQNRDIDNAMVRTPDIIYGVGKTYREVFDLEGLGWSHEHPNYVFARGVDEVIRSQQADTDKQGFEGVRVLLVEDEQVEGLDTTTLMDCKLDGASERFAGEVMNLSLRWRA